MERDNKKIRAIMEPINSLALAASRPSCRKDANRDRPLAGRGSLATPHQASEQKVARLVNGVGGVLVGSLQNLCAGRLLL